MSLITNFNGDVLQSPSASALYSNKGGIFTSIRNHNTYYPLPSAYRTAIPITGTYVIPKAFENRADLIANTLYGSEDYWWLVFWFNGMVDPFQNLTVGTIILVADITSVNSVLG